MPDLYAVECEVDGERKRIAFFRDRHDAECWMEESVDAHWSSDYDVTMRVLRLAGTSGTLEFLDSLLGELGGETVYEDTMTVEGQR